ncbi:MAG: hypothetical protein WKF59_11690 [Chitinophagaceae bacterium]
MEFYNFAITLNSLNYLKPKSSKMKKLLLAVALIGSSTAAVVAQETEMKTN